MWCQRLNGARGSVGPDTRGESRKAPTLCSYGPTGGLHTPWACSAQPGTDTLVPGNYTFAGAQARIPGL